MSHVRFGLHCHLFDLASGEETTHTHIPIAMLPSLDEFVRIADARAG